MEKDIKKYNLRQVKLMESKIKEYLNAQIPIRWLIDDLEALIRSIKLPPQHFVENFIAEWSNLEICYANVKYENRKDFNSFEKKLIEQALSNLTAFIEQYRKQHLFDFEDE